jgi:hypothetical protein
MGPVVGWSGCIRSTSAIQRRGLIKIADMKKAMPRTCPGIATER